jgi:RNA polymerase sigma-70 factor (sigma-E family)
VRQRTEFAEFVDGEIPRLLGYARALTGNDHDAWDLVQECLVRVGLKWSSIDRGGNPAAYARTTLARLNVDRLRRVGREGPSPDVPGDAVLDPAPEGIEPWLLEALNALPPRQRTALVLRYVDDLDLRGIADAMGCAIGTAKSHVSRGLQTLRERAPQGSSLAHLSEGDGDV